MKTVLSAVTMAMMLAGLLGGCGKTESKSDTQVAARVNGQEITVHQINFLLQRMGAVGEAQAKEAGKQVLAGLVEQEAVLQKALDQKIDRDPNVVQALEAARRQIMVQAYLEKQAKASPPTPEEISKYFDTHPELFQNRKIYRFNEVIALPRAEQLEAIRDQIEQSNGDMGRLAAWLKEQKIPFRGGPNERPSEQVPAELLPKLAQAKEGQIVMINMQGGLGILQYVSAREQPVTKEQARPVIERFLVNQKRMELAQAEMKHIKEAAKIEYVGAFAPDAAPAKTAEASSSKKPDPAKADAMTQSMDKGLSGLK